MLTWTPEDIASIELELLNEHGVHPREDEYRVIARDLRPAARLLWQCRQGVCRYADPPQHGGCPGQRAHVRREGHDVVVRYGPCARAKTAILGKRAAELLVSSRMPTSLRAKTLDDFRTSPANQAAMQQARRAAHDPKIGVVLAGPHRVGKTHLAAGVVNARVRSGRPAIFVVVAELLDELRKTKGRDDELLDLLIATPLLVLDDLGAERPTDFALEQLFLVLNGRVNQQRQTIVTTNLDTPDALLEALTPAGSDRASLAGRRVAERIGQLCTWVTVGEDLTLL